MDLPTLRILLDPWRSSCDSVLFQAVRGRGAPEAIATCTLRELGLPESLSGMQDFSDDGLRVPDKVMAAVDAAAQDVGWSPVEPHAALWLEFPSPRGLVYAAPWERLLLPLGRPLLRLPDHLVRPQSSGVHLEVAICASASTSRASATQPEVLQALTAQYLHETGLDVTVHLFPDAGAYETVAERMGEHGWRVVVHRPAGSVPEDAGRSRGPWLRRLEDALQGRAVDIVHVVTHGLLSDGRGAIAVSDPASTGKDRAVAARFVGATALTQFLSRLGAWGLVLSGPPGDRSGVALRELADAVARGRAGVTIAHEMEQDPSGEQLGAALGTILTSGGFLEEPLPATTVWVHPQLVLLSDDMREDLHLDDSGGSAFLASATRQALSDSGTQSWVASASRFLEGQQMRWLPASPEERADPAAVIALSNVAQLLERHVSRQYPSGPTSQGDS